MYTITFYSFKGGVGRTFALVNVAAELARRGRRVLLVDFDLEAPGLETFERLRPSEPHPGVVEYVKDYMLTKQLPDVQKYVYSVGVVGKRNGQLWVMPAGRRDRDYQAGLVTINWKRLYSDCKGFELFEDTKKQWEEAFHPDYVLIDSRTGHTDVEGICTRQLPDAVVVLFFPNEQNLLGLKDVCRRIRGEREQGLKKDIQLHFVMSNVPDLDDEDKVLRRRLQAFHKELGIKKLDAVIHRYESVMLFNQAIFVLDRPRSRLAREYRKLLRSLIRDNIEDRDGVLSFLHDYAQSQLPPVARRTHTWDAWERIHHIESRMDSIAGRFLNDAEVLTRIAECRALEGTPGRSVKLLDRALKLKPDLGAALFQRALCKGKFGDVTGATSDLLHYLQLPGLPEDEVLRVIRELTLVAPHSVSGALDRPGVQTLSIRGKVEGAEIVSRTPQGLDPAIQFLTNLLPNPAAWEVDLGGEGFFSWYLKAQRLTVVSSLLSCLLRAKRWQEASDLIDSVVEREKEALLLGDRLSPEAMIATWGLTGQLPKDWCEAWGEYVEDDDFDPKGYPQPLPEPGLNQVSAMAFWGLGTTPRALEELEKATKWMKQNGRSTFSWWRYDTVAPQEFLDDCEALRRMLQGEPIRPAFLSEPAPAVEPEGGSAEQLIEP